MPQPVSAIIPAHNEEKTVGDVVRTLVASGHFREVIVVSDGSTDRTSAVAREAGATLVHELPASRGKGMALSHGVTHTDAPIVCFFDADLRGLTLAHIAALLDPVTQDGRYMNVGMRDRGAILNAFARLFPRISGERALRREVFDSVPEKYLDGYRVETALNYFCEVNGLPHGDVDLPGLSIVTKIGKVGLLRAIPQYVLMAAQAAGGMVALRLARAQFVERGTHMSHHHR
jgi:glycosyltransferase involved in cell wall biosynthesis